MAKFSERDPRWIVEERADGTNVKNWHWTEKDCLAWSKTRLQELLSDVSLTNTTSKTSIRLVKMKSLEGEAFLNNRKNKLIASFDLVLRILWEGVNGEDKVEGEIEIPNLSEEQESEDWEIRIIPSVDSSFSQQCKDTLLNSGRQQIRSILTQFVSELKSGTNVDKTPDKTPGLEVAQSKDKTQEQVHELEIVENFYCNPEDIYECFVHVGRLQGFTQSPAKVESRVGGEFSWFDGSISGKFIKMDPGRVLELDWRFNSWSEDHYSRVVMNFSNPEPGLTVLTLRQNGIPESDRFGNANVVEVTDNGWRERILHRIRIVFGYGV